MTVTGRSVSSLYRQSTAFSVRDSLGDLEQPRSRPVCSHEAPHVHAHVQHVHVHVHVHVHTYTYTCVHGRVGCRWIMDGWTMHASCSKVGQTLPGTRSRHARKLELQRRTCAVGRVRVCERRPLPSPLRVWLTAEVRTARDEHASARRRLAESSRGS